MVTGPLYVIGKRPVWLTEFLTEDDWTKHLGLIELPIKVYPGTVIKMLNYRVDGTIDGLAQYSAHVVPSLLVHSGVTETIQYRFDPEREIYLAVQ